MGVRSTKYEVSLTGKLRLDQAIGSANSTKHGVKACQHKVIILLHTPLVILSFQPVAGKI
jgi:hypothetical protein